MCIFQSIKVLLNEYQIPFATSIHEATPTSADSAKARGELLSSGAKAIVMKVQNEFCLFVLCADMRIDPKKVKEYFKSVGKKAKKSRFATTIELKELTGLVPGSVPPFGQPILDLPLFVDPMLFNNQKISFNAGSLTNSITMNPKDYKMAAKPTVFEFAALTK